MMGNPNQMMGNPMMGNQNMMGNPNQMMGNPMMGNQNMMGNPNPMMVNQNMMCNPNMMGNMNPMMQNNNQMLMNNQLNQMQMPMNNEGFMNNQIMMNQMNGINQMPMQTMAASQLNQFQNANMQFQNPNPNQNPPNQNDDMSIQFSSTIENFKTISVQCKADEKMRDVIIRYWSKIGRNPPDKVRYIFGTKNVNQDLSVSENGLFNGHVIQVILTENVKGANNFHSLNFESN